MQKAHDQDLHGLVDLIVSNEKVLFHGQLDQSTGKRKMLKF